MISLTLRPLLVTLLIFILPLYSCKSGSSSKSSSMYGYIEYDYGEPVSYGEGRHPGLDYDVPIGTPVIASADGTVYYVDESGKWGGIGVGIQHSDLKTNYQHLSKVFVRVRQKVKRGDLIGLSGTNKAGDHLHFGVIKYFGNGLLYSNTYNPNSKGLNGKSLECFDPNRDYTDYPVDAITLPIPCCSDMDYFRAKLKDEWL